MMEPTLTRRPDFKLLKQSDVVSFFHMQMPRWLFFDSKYLHLSLESKVAYTFLLNRFQLSRMNGWINSEGEVFIIFPREKLAEEIGISYRKAIACFKELLAADLIWEHRLGRGNANHIYMAAVTLSEKQAGAHDSAPFLETAPVSEEDSRSAESAYLGSGAVDEDMRDNLLLSVEKSGESSGQDLPKPHIQTCKNGMSASAGSTYPEVPVSHPNKKDISQKERSHIEKVSQSGSVPVRAPTGGDGQEEMEDQEMLSMILEGCELEVLPEDEAGVFRSAITRLFYSSSIRMGNAVLPQPVIRSHLYHLTGLIILDTREKLRKNLDKPVRNSMAYVMAALFNNIWEYTSDLMVDPYLNTMAACEQLPQNASGGDEECRC